MNSQFQWKDVGDGCLGPSTYECWKNGKKVAKVVGKFDEYFVDILKTTYPEGSSCFVKMRVTVPDDDIFGTVESLLRTGTLPPGAQDHTHDDMMVKINNEAAAKRGSALDEFFEGDYY